MSNLSKKRKCDLKELAIEFGATIRESDSVAKIIKKLTETEDYDEELALAQIEIIENDRLEREREEKTERERIKKQESDEKSLAAEREHELAKLRLKNDLDNASIASSEVQREPKISLKSVLPKFDAEKSEISIYLSLFERQAQKAQIEKKQWVTHLLGLLPTELGEIILRETIEDSDNFDYIKKVLLERFKLSAEDFRLKFVTTFKPENKTWKDFVYDTTNYFDQWLSGLDIKTFDQLRDLIITDQLKRKVAPEIKNHFIDMWSSINTPFELANKLDAYDSARKSIIRPVLPKYSSNTKSSERNKFKEKSNIDSDTEEKIPNWRDKENLKNRDEIFDKRREITCFACSEKGHYRYACPKLRNSEKVERISFVSGLEDLEQAVNPYISRGLINGRELKLIRDCGSNLDLISAHDVKPNQYTGDYVWVKQALSNKLRRLPIVNIKLHLETGEIVQTKAAAVDKETDMSHYLLGNKTQELIDKQKVNPLSINMVTTRQRARRIYETPNSKNETEVRDSARIKRKIPQANLTEDRRKKIANACESREEENSGSQSLQGGKRCNPPNKNSDCPGDRSGPKPKVAEKSRENLPNTKRQDIRQNMIRKIVAEKKSGADRKIEIIIPEIAEEKVIERNKSQISIGLQGGILSLTSDGLDNDKDIKENRNGAEKEKVRDKLTEQKKNSVDADKILANCISEIVCIFTQLWTDTVNLLSVSENEKGNILIARDKFCRYLESEFRKNLRSRTGVNTKN